MACKQKAGHISLLSLYRFLHSPTYSHPAYPSSEFQVAFY